MSIIAQITLAAGGIVRVLLYGGILMAGIIVAGIILVVWVRRLVRSGPRRSEEGFSVEHLERIHRAGQISDEEFSRLRRAAMGMTKASGGKADSSLSYSATDDDDKSNGASGTHPGAR